MLLHKAKTWHINDSLFSHAMFTAAVDKEVVDFYIREFWELRSPAQKLQIQMQWVAALGAHTRLLMPLCPYVLYHCKHQTLTA